MIYFHLMVAESTVDCKQRKLLFCDLLVSDGQQARAEHRLVFNQV